MRRILSAVFVGTLLTACGGGGDPGEPTPPPTTTPSITLTLGATTVSAVQGASATVPITVTRSGGASGAIALAAEGAPSGVTPTFTPTSIPDGASSGTLTLAVASSAAAATTTITVRASAAGVTARTATVALTVTAAATPDFTLAASPAALTVVAGQSGSAALSITRSGGFTGAVALGLEGAPAGVTPTFAPNPATGATSALGLAVAASVPAGTYPLTVRGTSGALSRTATVSLVVAAAPSVAVALLPSTLSVAQGASGQSTVTLTRSGGLTGDVTLTANAPAGVSVAFAPASVSGATSVATVSVTAGAAAGSYPITVTATGAGGVSGSTSLALTVTPGTSGGGNVSWRFCKATRVPLWFAYRDGSAGAWTRVTAGANGTFTFPVAQAKAEVAYVVREVQSQPIVTVHFLTRAELQSVADAECADNPALGKTVMTNVAGLGAGERASLFVGGGQGIAFANGTGGQVTNVQDGPQPLLGVRSAGMTINRFALLRDVNVSAGATLPLLDFGGAASFAPVSATLTIGNAGTDEVGMNGLVRWANGTVASYQTEFGSSAPRPFIGLPDDRLAAGDLHGALISASDNVSGSRIVWSYFRSVAARTLTLGPVANAPTITSATSGGLARLRARAALQAEYRDAVSVFYSQSNGSVLPSVALIASGGWLGGTAAEYDLQIPDLAGLPGFEAVWGMQPGRATDVSVLLSGSLGGTFGVPTDGASWRIATRQSTVTP